MLLDLSCKTGIDCWPDPDDVDLAGFFGKRKVYQNRVDDMLWIKPDGTATLENPTEFPVRAVWIFAYDRSNDIPKKARLEFDDSPMTETFEVSAKCQNISDEMLANIVKASVIFGQ